MAAIAAIGIEPKTLDELYEKGIITEAMYKDTIKTAEEWVEIYRFELNGSLAATQEE